MIVDTHCHYWSLQGVPYYNNAPLELYLKEQRIDKISLICMNEKENEGMCRQVRAHPGTYFGIAYLDFNRMEDFLTKLRAWVKEGIVKGVKLYPYFEHFDVDDRAIYPFYETAVELGLPVLPHMGWVCMDEDASCHHKGSYRHTGFPVQYGRVMEDFPALKLIVSHLGGNYYYEFLTMAERFGSMIMETAWLPDYCMRHYPPLDMSGWIEHAVRFLGPERVMYAGEGVFPQDILRLDLPMAQKSLILSQNAVRYFGL